MEPMLLGDVDTTWSTSFRNPVFLFAVIAVVLFFILKKGK